jgi:two-component system, LytTR family, sensor histidine kinase AlgZ
MTSVPGFLQRARLGLFAIAAVAAAALTSSTFLLWRSGTPLRTSIAAAVPPSLLLGVIGLASRYLCRAMPLRTAGVSRILAAHAGSAAAASGLWLLTWNWWLAILPAPSPVKPDLSFLFGLGVMIYVVTMTVHYLFLELESAREAEEAALRYQIMAREAELRAFKAQIDPHFLFNSLNAVASLCGTRPSDARAMAQLLADFFRQTLHVGSLERITLGEEIELVSRYLAIEKVRFGDRLEVRIDVDPAAAACFVPPLLLQPLVENAVRHGIASVVEGGAIDILATFHDGRLRIRIDNPADPDRVVVNGEGIGLENARGRLKAMSDGRASFQTEEASGRYRVDIELPR